MNVVIVESPAKAKSIGKYLGSDFKVLASYGHVRDLPSKNGSVDPEHDFAMVWEVSSDGKKNLKLIGDAVKKADALYLATDPDREGEAIAWHVLEVLKEKKILKDQAVYRSVFHEVTKKAILSAIENPRELNQELVEAYLARRALDYLVGFNLSPVLWRKLPGSKSAGRVQSVALRLITEREGEIEKFNPEEYWTIEADFKNQESKLFTGKLTYLNGEKLKKFSLNSEALATDAVNQINPQDFHVGAIERKEVKRHPAPPFITSTLQQEAARKLHFGVSRTMQVAQRLYEGFDFKGETVGLITYMRTDSVTVSGDFITACRDYIEAEYGSPYKPQAPRAYKSKVKNAQEAHEAIRPTDLKRTPKSLANILDPQQLKLYTLIWRRALASQMESAILDQVGADIVSKDKKITFRSTGSTVKFDGFFCLYKEGKDEEDGDDKDQDKHLPVLRENEDVSKEAVRPDQHFTQPPPRYSEASLVKKMEELGIGRPSTYASIMQVLQVRNYVTLDKRQFIPDGRGRLVSTFLENFFKKYVEYDFTASLEDELDDIAGGKLAWRTVIQNFWSEFKSAIDGTKDLKVSDVLDVLDEELGAFFFPDNNEDRTCPTCKKGKLHLKLGRFGAFIGCTDYPECKHTQQVGDTAEEAAAAGSDEYPKVLGKDDAGLEVTVRKGPYGVYVQLGEGAGKAKPKRASLTKDMDPAQITLEKALDMLALPKEIGKHPETGELLTLGIGRYGPYVKHGKAYVSIKKDNLLEVTVERAVEIIQEQAENKKKKK